MTLEEFYNSYGLGKQEELDHEFLLSIFQEPIDEKFLEEHNVPDLIIDIMGTYEEEREFDLLYEFTEHLRTHNPAVFDQSFQYLHGPLIDHFLFREKPEQVEKLAEDFMRKPVEVFDDMQEAFKKVRFYNSYNDLLDRWAEAVYKPVEESEELMMGAGSDLAYAKYAVVLERIYEEILKKGAFDRSEMRERVDILGMNTPKEHLNLLEKAFSTQLKEVKEVYGALLSGQKNEGPYFLHKAFLVYMKRKHISFPVSWEIWSYFLKYWSEEKEGKVGSEIFPLKPKAFYTFLESNSGIIMDYRFLAAAILWGGNYVYDFLRTVDLVSAEVYEKTQSMLMRMQRLFTIENYTHLWEYDFVHRWENPDSKSDYDDTEEREAFNRSYEIKREELPPLVSEGDPELKSLRKEFKTKRKNLFNEMLSGIPEEPPSRPSKSAPSNKYAKPVKPVRSDRKIGRNEKVDVRYTDGTDKKGIKYKHVQRDIEEGKCEIIS